MHCEFRQFHDQAENYTEQKTKETFQLVMHQSQTPVLKERENRNPYRMKISIPS